MEEEHGQGGPEQRAHRHTRGACSLLCMGAGDLKDNNASTPAQTVVVSRMNCSKAFSAGVPAQSWDAA